jgi:hypothetical protein
LSYTGIINVIYFTLHIQDPDVMSVRHDPLVGIVIIYLAIKFRMLNMSRVVKWLIVIQQPILEFTKYTVYEYSVIIFEHKSTIFVSPGTLNSLID